MESNAPNRSQDVRYEPDERPPLPLTAGLGLQYAVLTVTSVVLTPAILIGTVGGSEAYLSWVIFAALVVSGATTVIQVARVGRVGSGYLLLMGTSSAFLAICLAALERGGGGLLAILIIVSSLCQFVLAAKLSLQGGWGELLANGLTVGGLTVIVLTQFVELTGPRARRLKTELALENFSRIDAFLSDFAARGKRSAEMSDRLRAVGEELLLTLTRPGGEDGTPARRHLLLVARDDGDAVELEFAATTDDANLEDQLALLGERAAGPRVEEEVSLRLRRHYASAVRHQQFHDTDVVTVRVGPAAAM